MKNLKTDIPIAEPSQEELDAVPDGKPFSKTPPEQFEARLAISTGHGPNGEPVVYNGVPLYAGPTSKENPYASAAASVVKSAPQTENPFAAAAQSVVSGGGLGPAPADEDEKRKVDLLRWRVANETRSPEEQGEVLRLSAALGWSPDVVAGDLPKARAAVDSQGLDAEKVLRAHPALADFIADPRTTALARSDTERLSGLAYLTGVAQMTSDRPAVPGAVELWLKQGSMAKELHEQQLARMLGTVPEDSTGTPEFDATGTGLPAMRPMTDAEKEKLGDAITKKSDELRKLESYGDGVESMGFGKQILAKAARFVLTQAPSIAEGAAVAAVGSAAAGPVGGLAAGGAFWAYETAPGINWQLAELKDPYTGKALLSDDEARNYAIGASIPIGLLQAGLLEGAGASLTKWKVSKPIVERALSLIAQPSVEKLLERQGLAAALERASFHYGTHVVQGGLLMGMQGGLTQATLEIAAGQHGVDAPGSSGESFVEGFKKGMQDFALIAAWGPARRAFGEYGQIRASHESAQVLRDIAENTLKSKTAQAAPEEFGKLMNAFAGDKTVYVDVEAVDEYAQKQKVNPRELAAGIIGDDGQAYDAAKASGNLAVPMGAWAEKVVLPGHAEALSPDTKLNINELTPRQMQEKAKLLATQMEDRAQERGPAFEEEVKALRDTIAGVAKEGGHSRDQGATFAETLSKHAAAMSLRFDVPLREALIHSGLTQLRLEGLPVLGKLMDALNLTPEERAVAEGQGAQGVQEVPNGKTVDLTSKLAQESLKREGLKFQASFQHKGTGDIVNTGPFHDLSQIPGGTNAYGSGDWVDGFTDQKGKFYTRQEAADALNIRGKELASGAAATEDLRPLGAMLAQENKSGLRMPNGSEVEKPKAPPELHYKNNKSITGQIEAEGGRVVIQKGDDGKYEVRLDGDVIGRYDTRDNARQTAQAAFNDVWRDEFSQDTRGTIRFKVDGSGRSYGFDINALHGDASTLAHETGHFLSWSLHDLASRADAPEAVKADYAALLKLGGWKDAEERLSENAERSRLERLKNPDEAQKLKLEELTAKEEKLSHAWELYLAEGKAPSKELRGTFARFRRWMGEVYGNLGGITEQYKKTYGQDLWLSDDVRGVFGRMLAVDNEVERLRADDSNDWSKVLNLSPDEAARELSLRTQKMQAARDGLDRVTAGYASESAKGFLRAERERIRADVHDEVSAEAPYRAFDFFKTGEWRDENGRAFAPGALADVFRGEDGKPLRLSYAEAVKDAGKETADILRKRGVVTEKKGGVSAEETPYRLMGFASGKDMLVTFAGLFDKDAVVEHLTAGRFEDTFGMKLHELGDALSAAGQNALHNPADILHALYIRDAIARQLGGGKGRKLPVDVLNENAERIVVAQRVRDVSSKFYLDSERRYAKETRDILAKAFRAKEGNPEEADGLFSDAYHKWDSVVLAKLLWAHARDVRAEMDASEARLQRYAKGAQKVRLGTADQSLALADANESILGAIGMTTRDEKGRPVPTAGKPEHVDAVLALMQKAGAEDVALDTDGRLKSALWDADALRDLVRSPKAWKDLSVEEARNVRAAVENIAALARLSNYLNVMGTKMSMDTFIAKTEESSRYLGKEKYPADPKAISRLQKILRPGLEFLQNVDANLTEIRNHIERLTGGDREHPLYKFFVGDREQARHFENVLSERFGSRINELWNEMPKSMRKLASKEIAELRDDLPMPEGVAFPDKDSPRSRSWLWMVALNMGNEGNKQRLLKGYGWSEGQVHAALQKHLSAQELKFVQDVWDSLGDLYPHVEKTHIADKGVRPEKVEASPFKLQLPDGQVVEMKGGYFPVRYDPRVPMQGHFGERQASAVSTEVPIYSRPKTVQQHTMARAESAEGLLHLNFDVVPGHVTQVIHDVSHRLWVKQASRIVHDPRFEGLAKERLGQEYEKQFRSWVQDVANQYNSTASESLGKTERFFSFAKSATTLSAVGFNLAVPLADLTNPLLPIIGGDISPLYMMKVTRQLATRWPELRAFALENSVELNARKHHGNSMGIDPSLSSGKGSLGKIQKIAYAAMEASDRATATPIWLAKYMQGLGEHGDHDVAVRDAEATVQKYFPQSDMASRAALLRDKGFLGQLTFLWGFGSKVYNLNRGVITDMLDAIRDPEESTGDKSLAVAKAVGMALGYAVVIGGLSDFVSGKGPKRTGTAADWVKEKALSYAQYNIPLLQFWSDRSAIPAAGLWAKFKNEAHRSGAEHGIFSPKPNEKPVGEWESLAALGSALAVTGGAPGVGLNQALRTGKYLDNRAGGDLRRGQYGRLVSGLIYGDSDRITPFNIGQR